jgi:hypothetical protein
MATKFYNSIINGSSSLVNGNDGHTKDRNIALGSSPLNISIVGAGIGGLTAAIGLRRNGHNVSVRKSQAKFWKVLTVIRSMNSPNLQTRPEPRSTLLPIQTEFSVDMGYSQKSLAALQCLS